MSGKFHNNVLELGFSVFQIYNMEVKINDCIKN